MIDEKNLEDIDKKSVRYCISNLYILVDIVINLIIFILSIFISIRGIVCFNFNNIYYFDIKFISYIFLFLISLLFLIKSLLKFRYFNNYIEIYDNGFKARISNKKYNVLDSQINNIVIKKKIRSGNIQKYFIKIYFKDEDNKKYNLKLSLKDLFKFKDQENIKNWIEEKNELLFKNNKHL